MNALTTGSDLDWTGVFATLPLARSPRNWAVDWDESERIVEHVREGGISRLLLGESAQVQHITLKQYRELLEWLVDFTDEMLVVPGLGPSFGRAYQQAEFLARHPFPAAMVLPIRDDRDPAGLELGYRKLAERAEMPLLVVLRDLVDWGRQPQEVAERLGRLAEDDLVAGILFDTPPRDPGTGRLIEVCRQQLEQVSLLGGGGELRAEVFLGEHGVRTFVSGAACVAPRLTRKLYLSYEGEDLVAADSLVTNFRPFHQLSEAWGTVAVLNAAVNEAGVADMGPLLPYLNGLSSERRERIRSVARTLRRQDQEAEVRRAGLL